MKLIPFLIAIILISCSTQEDEIESDQDVGGGDENGPTLINVSPDTPVYLKLDDGISKTTADDNWEISIHGTVFQTNSGTSGSNAVGAYKTGKTDFDSVIECDYGQLSYDEDLALAAGQGEGSFSMSPVLRDWYDDYDDVSKTAVSKKNIYLISDKVTCFKFQIISYEDGAFLMRASALIAPTPFDSVRQTLDASSYDESLYLVFKENRISQASEEGEWNIAIKRYWFQTNSGSSGSGPWGAYKTNDTNFEDVQECSYDALSYDEMITVPYPEDAEPNSGNPVLNGWYDYDMTTHKVSSRKEIFLISDGESCYKLQVISYDDGVYKVFYAALVSNAGEDDSDDTDKEGTTIKPTSPDTPVYFKLGGGISKTTSDNWDISIHGTVFQTNSGTSGSKSVGAYKTGKTNFDNVTECYYDQLVYDQELELSEDQGTGTFSMSPVLRDWYDNYDATHQTAVSKKEVYLISDKVSCFKLQILSYEDGAFQLKASALDAPTPYNSVRQTLNASSYEDSLYLVFKDNRISQASEEGEWNIAIKRYWFQTNSGSSGSGQWGAYKTNYTNFEDVQECSYDVLSYDGMITVPYPEDAESKSGNPVLNTWYDYEMSTHKVSSRKEIFLISDGESCYKLQIISYDDGVYKVFYGAIVSNAGEDDSDDIEGVDVEETEVSPSSPGAAIYLKLGDEITETTAEGAWDILLDGIIVQTNSDRSVGAYSTGKTSFVDVYDCSYDLLSFNEELSLLEDADVKVSMNPAFREWYSNYNETSHSASSLQGVYLIANGDTCFKFQIMSYEDGIYGVKSYSMEAPPVIVGEQVIDASSFYKTKYLAFKEDRITETVAEGNWAIAIKQFMFKTNSGTSDSGYEGEWNAHRTNYTMFENVDECSFDLLSYDEWLPVPGSYEASFSGNPVLNTWYEYDNITDSFNSRQKVFILTNGQSCYKLQILSYLDGFYQVKYEALEYPDSVSNELKVDASNTDLPVYLRLGDKVSETSIDGAWDIAVKMLQFQTNSGASRRDDLVIGNGAIGAFNTGSTDYDGITACDYDELIADEDFEPQTSWQLTSDNLALRDWYSGGGPFSSPTTKGLVYIISDGLSRCYKLQIEEYDGGTYTLNVDTLSLP